MIWKGAQGKQDSEVPSRCTQSNLTEPPAGTQLRTGVAEKGQEGDTGSDLANDSLDLAGDLGLWFLREYSVIGTGGGKSGRF